MNAVELAKLFTDYAETKAKLAKLAEEIAKEVAALKATQKIAGVAATYYKDSFEYDYEAAAKSKNPTKEQIDAFSTPSVSTRWKELAESLGAELESFKTPKPARVAIK